MPKKMLEGEVRAKCAGPESTYDIDHNLWNYKL